MSLDIGKLLFYKRGKGRVTKSLSVYQFKNCYILRFLTYHRPQITREQKNEGIKEKRINTLDENIFFKNIKEIEDHLYQLPHQDLTKDFLENFLGKK